MRTIRGLKMLWLHNAEYLQFLRDVRDAVQSAVLPPSPPLAECLADLVAAEAAVSAIFGRARGSLLTRELEVLDARRDAAVTGLRMVAGAYTRHPAADKRAAGALLSHVTGLYGGIAGKNYNEESAGLGHLAHRLADRPELAAAIETLHLGDWVAELAAANAAFDAKYAERISAKAAAATPATMVALRERANKAWYALRENIAAYHTINGGAEPWGSLAGRLNALIEQYAQTLRVRKGRAAARSGQKEGPLPE